MNNKIQYQQQQQQQKEEEPVYITKPTKEKISRYAATCPRGEKKIIYKEVEEED